MYFVKNILKRYQQQMLAIMLFVITVSLLHSYSGDLLLLKDEIIQTMNNLEQWTAGSYMSFPV
jgi:hypothetical protein